MTDAELQFLEQLYRQHYQRLFLYAKAIVKNEHLAEEAVQDTFHIACSKIAEVRRSENAAGWLVQTLKNVLRNMERTHSSLYAALQKHLPYEDHFLGGQRDEENIELLYGGILTEEEFRLLRCIVLEKDSFLEVSARFGISVEACRQRFQRIKEKMRKNLVL